MVGETWHRQWRVVDNLVRECVPVIALTVLGVADGNAGGGSGWRRGCRHWG